MEQEQLWWGFTECGTVYVGLYNTFMVAKLSIRALSAFKAACGHTVDDALSRARLTVFTTVREWHLQDDKKVKLEKNSKTFIPKYRHSVWQVRVIHIQQNCKAPVCIL